MAKRVLVACVGNIFLGDDGFGVEVYQELMRRPDILGDLPAGVEIADIGIRGVHLVHELLDGCDLLVVVDAAPRDAAPGTVSVIEVGPGDGGSPPPLLDAHGLGPGDVFALLDLLASRPARTLVVACEPADLSPGMQLSDPVREAVPYAAATVRDIIFHEMREM